MELGDMLFVKSLDSPNSIYFNILREERAISATYFSGLT